MHKLCYNELNKNKSTKSVGKAGRKPTFRNAKNVTRFGGFGLPKY